MATLKRSHTPMPWGVPVEKTVWKRSQPGKLRRRRSERPCLTYDPGWDWDGTRVLFDGKSDTQDREESDCGSQVRQLWEDVPCSPLSGRTCATLSLLDIAHRGTTKRRSKVRSGLDDFEVVRVPKVHPISEEEPDPGDYWGLREWERLDVLSFKRTYSEVVQGFADEKGGSPHSPSFPRYLPTDDEDDDWECL